VTEVLLQYIIFFFAFLFFVKAFCETLEETNYHLQRELLEKQKEVESLKKLLGEKQLHIDALETRIRWVMTQVCRLASLTLHALVSVTFRF
jgi:predicted RNase H-like nuclease (RuvC/YqgF family)